MKLDDAQKIYEGRSAKASDLCRQLALAGLAVVWLFKIDNAADHTYAVPHGLVWPIILMVLTLLFDLLQYACAWLLWGWFRREKELEFEARAAAKEYTSEPLPEDYSDKQDFIAPRWINWPTLGCFYTKQATIVVGYALLLYFLHSRITS